MRFPLILVAPVRAENVGAAARAMKTMGFSELHIVGSKTGDPRRGRNSRKFHPLGIAKRGAGGYRLQYCDHHPLTGEVPLLRYAAATGSVAAARYRYAAPSAL